MHCLKAGEHGQASVTMICGLGSGTTGRCSCNDMARKAQASFRVAGANVPTYGAPLPPLHQGRAKVSLIK